MAIVKATYTKSSGGAKASIRYIEHRPGKDNEKVTFNIHELSTIEDFVISNGTRFGNFNSVKLLLQILFNLFLLA